ncbi:hypothetical protein SAY86_013101 [Trapa natans]|uniref:Uncharacterized protein n=1 Tax=Trapa natans TaxID=22666 RepID=A0AAN7R9T6_TRANT|nr:hypothetical protein SAY86_013101 [Trapa natans]
MRLGYEDGWMDGWMDVGRRQLVSVIAIRLQQMRYDLSLSEHEDEAKFWASR